MTAPTQNPVKELPLEFEGRGEVKGFVFKLEIPEMLTPYRGY